jgi:hypothetical protein
MKRPGPTLLLSVLEALVGVDGPGPDWTTSALAAGSRVGGTSDEGTTGHARPRTAMPLESKASAAGGASPIAFRRSWGQSEQARPC